MSFDSIYANECIDSIIKNSKRMLDLYRQMQHTAEDKATIAELYTSVRKAISKYYEYLEKTGVPVEKSYLTHWLDQWEFHDHFEEIHGFLHE